MKTAALVFSGGALRGFAQIGAMRVIEEFLHKKNIKIKTIVGTSFGSITATYTALGYSAHKMNIISKKVRFRIIHFIDPRNISIRGPAFVTRRKIHNYLKTYIGNKTFQDAKYNLIINTVDALSGKHYIFTKKGLECVDDRHIIPKNIHLIDAIEASIAVPSILYPKKMFGLMLMDGGLISPMGLDLINPKEYDYVICIDVCMANFNFITSKKPSKLNMIQQSISIMQKQIHFKKLNELAKRHNVIVIRPPVGSVNLLHNNIVDKIMRCGFEEAKRVLKV